MIYQPKSYTIYFTALFFALILLWFTNMSLGSVNIPLSETLKILLHQPTTNEVWQTIVYELRIPKSLTAVIVGAGLSVTGLVLQTLFRNPMAGPSVLGISSGAGLGVALLLLGSSFFSTLGWEILNIKWSLVLSAVIGSMAVLFLILTLSIRLKNSMSVLIIGLMLSALTSSFVSMLSYFSSAQKLQQYIFWGFGNLSLLRKEDLLILSTVVILAVLGMLPLIKPMNSLLLGENFAKSVGIPIQKTKNYILILSAVIIGVITAFVGPIAFIGLAVPHITRLIFKTSNHKVLLPASLLMGSSVMLLCDTLSQLPLNGQVIPINAITSLIGAPVVIILILRQKSYRF